jgi:hypothetical protein
MPIFYKSFLSLSNPLGIIVRVRTLERRLRKMGKGKRAKDMGRKRKLKGRVRIRWS